MSLRTSSLFFALIFFGAACTNSKKAEQGVNINQSIANNLFSDQDNVLILSCVRCGCFLDAIKDAYKKDSIFLRKIYLVTDTNCTKLKLAFNHRSQKQIDSISEDLYNIILMRRDNNGYQIRQIETKESPKTLEIIRNYFK